MYSIAYLIDAIAIMITNIIVSKAIIIAIIINIIGINLGKRIMIIKMAENNRRITISSLYSFLRHILLSLMMGLSSSFLGCPLSNSVNTPRSSIYAWLSGFCYLFLVGLPWCFGGLICPGFLALIVWYC
jgi:hypothetical protein